MNKNGRTKIKKAMQYMALYNNLDPVGRCWISLPIIDHQQHSAIHPGRPFSRPLAGFIFSMQSYYLTEREFFTR